MKLTITPLTAVHIGTGEELTPLDYKLVRLEDETNRFCKFSSDKILSRMINSNLPTDIKDLQKIIQSKCMEEDIDYKCKITKQFKEIYEANSKKDPLQNAARVFEIYRSKNNFAPIIPGSSIKGAIRTAVLSEKGQENNDLFRSLAIADCEFPNESTVVGTMQILNKKGKKNAEKMQILADVILGNCIEGRNVIGKTDLTIYENLQEHLTFDSIREKCNEFYLREFKKEYETFYEKNKNSDEYGIVRWLKEQLEKIKEEKSFLIRLGRWSQVEFVTFQPPFRNPSTRKGKDGKPLPYGTTRTVLIYSNRFVPMGWCVCSISPTPL